MKSEKDISPIKTILVIKKKDIKEDFILVSIHDNGEIKSNIPINIQTWEYGEENGFKTAKTNHHISTPLGKRFILKGEDLLLSINTANQSRGD